MDSKCLLCNNHFPTVHHILSNCPEALRQGRYTWRHDCALKTQVNGLRKHLEPGDNSFADLPNQQFSDNPPATIPTDTLDSSARQDIVVIREREIFLLELISPHNSPESIANAKEQKENKENYQLALRDLDAKGLNSSLFTIEIGTLGRWLPQSCWSLQETFPSLSKPDATNLLDQTATKVISASRQIFQDLTAPGTLPVCCTDHCTTCPLTDILLNFFPLFILTCCLYISIL